MTKRKPGEPGHARGADHWAARLRPDQVAEIRRRYATGERMVVLAGAYGVGYTAIQKLVRGTNWRSVDDAKPTIPDKRRWTADDIAELRVRRAEPNAEIAAALGRSVRAVAVMRSRLGMGRARSA